MREENEESEKEDWNKALELRRKVLDLTWARNLKILDIGAGPLATIAAKEFSCSVTSIDINRKEIDVWREHAIKEGVSGRIIFEEVDAANMSLGLPTTYQV